MSGHSKWATIKRDKGANDAKKGAIFTKLANALTIAVKTGHGMQLALEKAKQANMPKDKIQHAIDRASSHTDANLTEAIFEGFGPGGCAIIIETITDNSTRTSQLLRSVFIKNNCALGTPGSVAYLFTRVGEIEGVTFDQAVEVGALDFEDGVMYTKPEDLHKIGASLNKTGSLIYKPNKETMVQLNAEDTEKLQNLLEAIDSLDDVQNIYINSLN